MKLGQKVLGKKLFGEIMKRTFYGQFVAGPVFSNAISRLRQIHVFNSGHCGDHTHNCTDAQLRGEEHPGLQRGGGHQPGGGWAERDGVGCFLLFFLWIQSGFFISFSSSCVSRVDSQRAQSPIPGVVEDKQFAGEPSSLSARGTNVLLSTYCIGGFLKKEPDSNELINFTSIDELERYQAHKEFGDRRIGVYGARTFFYQANLFHIKWRHVTRITEVHLGRGKLRAESWDVPSLHRDGGQHHPGNTLTSAASKELLENFTNLQTTGFAAIKLTALGRPQLLVRYLLWLRQQEFVHSSEDCFYRFSLQLQLSEVIARARRYHEEVTGKKGQVSLPPYHNVFPWPGQSCILMIISSPGDRGSGGSRNVRGEAGSSRGSQWEAWRQAVPRQYDLWQVTIGWILVTWTSEY